MIVDELKSSILFAAVSGNLVKNNEDDQLVYKIIDSANSRVWEYSKKQKIDILPISENDCPFDIPESWRWVRLHAVCSYIQRGKSPKYSNIKQYPVVAQKCNQWNDFSLDKALFIEPESINSYTPERFLKTGDIIINSTGGGSCGRIGIYDENINPYECAVADSHITVVRCYKDLVSYKYIYYYLSNPSVQSIIESQAVGTTNQIELLIDTIRNYPISLPPLEEQQRIVDKIEELFTKLDELKPIEEELNELKKNFPGKMRKAILKYYFNENNHNTKKLSDCITVISSNNYKIQQKKILSEGKFPVVSQSNMYIEGYYDDENLLLKHKEPVLVYGDHTNNIKYIDFNFIIGADGAKILKCKESFNAKFVYYNILYNSLFISNGGYSRHYKYIKESPIVVTTLEEQQRIVDKLEQLLPLCDDIENIIGE